MKEWHCYVCGKTLTSIYYLVGGNRIDRVFLICSEKRCIEYIDCDYIVQKIREIK